MSTSSSTHVGPTPIVVTHQHGLRFSVRIGLHELIVDQPVTSGGEDWGPQPLDLLAASLGSCIALYVHKFLMSRHLPTDGLAVEVMQHVVEKPRRVAEFEARILLPAEVPAVYRPMIEAVAHVCPAHNTLIAGAQVRIALEQPTAVA